MRKFVALMAAITVLFAAAALADDWMSFRNAVDAAGEYAAIGGDIDYLAVASEKDGRYFRSVTILDSRAKELYMAAMSAEDPGAGFEAFDAYAWSLPVCYTEEITAKPKGQAELDAQAGKTVGELLEEGYSFYGSGGGENLPTVVDLSSGLFIYEFEVDTPFEEFRALEEEPDGLKGMKVKSGKLSPFMNLATNPDYLADGTYQPQVVPHITAEEISAADSVPPLEEYSRKAWPIDAEGYSDLQHNLDARYGQVYMVKGFVRQILSKNPMRVIVCTGEDGYSQPVVVECPETRNFTWEEGKSYRIYADVTSACYVLPVLTARYTLYTASPDQADGTPLSEEPAAPEESAVKGTVAGNIKTYEEMADGTWMCDGQTYQYRLEIKGRMPNAAVDSSFVYLSNIREISFEQAYMAAGLSSNSDDYFSPEEAVLVDMN